MAQRHQSVPPARPPRVGFSITSAFGVHPTDHRAHHLKIVRGEVGPALTQNVQDPLTSWGACLVRETPAYPHRTVICADASWVLPAGLAEGEPGRTRCSGGMIMSDLTTSNGSTGLSARATEAADELDQRFHLAAGLRRQINKVFPGHWSFMLGEIALYSFVVLLLSGTYLALYFDPSMVEVTYQGPFVPLRGIEMSQAFASTMNLSFVVRGGLFIRQIHHWAALVFVPR